MLNIFITGLANVPLVGVVSVAVTIQELPVGILLESRVFTVMDIVSIAEVGAGQQGPTTVTTAPWPIKYMSDRSNVILPAEEVANAGFGKNPKTKSNAIPATK